MIAIGYYTEKQDLIWNKIWFEKSDNEWQKRAKTWQNDPRDPSERLRGSAHYLASQTGNSDVQAKKKKKKKEEKINILFL